MFAFVLPFFGHCTEFFSGNHQVNVDFILMNLFILSVKIHWRFQKKSIRSLIPKFKDRRTDRKEFVCLGRPLILLYWYCYQEKQCKTVNLKVGMDANKTIANLSVKVKFPREINKWTDFIFLEWMIHILSFLYVDSPQGLPIEGSDSYWPN